MSEPTYKALLTEAMIQLGSEDRVRFIGYDMIPSAGSQGGTLNGVPLEKRIEMPLAESLMASAAVGMSLGGFLPVLVFERFDFIFRALDPLVLHLDKLAVLSQGLHRPACIIRVAIGNRTTPMFAGPTHTEDLTVAMRDMLSFRVTKLMWKASILNEYAHALSDLKMNKSTMLIEDLDLYGT